MRMIRLPAILMALTLPCLAQVNVDEKADQTAALKIELEKARDFRDQVIAKRWEDKQKYVDSREKFNAEYEELKEALELKRLTAERMKEEIHSFQREAEEAEARLEDEKIRFATLNAVPEQQLDQLRDYLQRGIPIQVPKRQERINQAKKSLETKKDAPEEFLSDVVDVYRQELALTREIDLSKKGFLMADNSPGEGLFLRLGMVNAAYRDNGSGRTGMLLQKPGMSGGGGYEWREDLTESAKASLNQALQIVDKQSAELTSMPVDVLLNKSMKKAYTVAEQKTLGEKTSDFLKAGGVFIWPLLLIPIAALLLLIERFLTWRVKGSGNSNLYAAVLERLAHGNVKEAREMCGKRPRNVILKAICAVISNRDKSRELAEKNLEEVMLHEVPLLEKRLATISVLGAAAPLLGLLGTVSGLIGMFEAITSYGTNDPKLLAGGISEALVTTQTGLIVAVPIMLAHNFMANRMDQVSGDMEKYALKALNTLWPEG